MWEITVAHAAINWGLHNLLSWVPTFYQEQCNLNINYSEFLSVLPFVAGAMSGLLSSYLAGAFIKNNALSSNGDNVNIGKLC